jgi:hypothetical protein
MDRSVNPAGGAPARVHDGRKILIVDDHAEVLRVLRTSLESHGYIVCGEAENGIDAIGRASYRAGELTDRDVRGTRHAVPVSDTLCESNSDIPLHRATSHRRRLASDLGSVLRAGETTPPLVPPGRGRVPAKASRRSPPEKNSYGDPVSKKREAYTEPGKQRWCRHRSLVR